MSIDLESVAKKQGIKYFLISFTDLLGGQRSKLVPASAIAEDSVTGRRGIGTDVSSARITEQSHSRVWLENALAFADTPGEWFLNATAGELYYVAAEGEDPNRSRFSAPVVRELLVFRGSPEKLVRQVRVQALEAADLHERRGQQDEHQADGLNDELAEVRKRDRPHAAQA